MNDGKAGQAQKKKHKPGNFQNSYLVQIIFEKGL